jgi:UDP-N-acetyl-D-mannosaminuronic acid dehydrogenase
MDDADEAARYGNSTYLGGRMSFELDVAVIGGCGRAGLPLGIAFAGRGLNVVLYDINSEAVERIARGEMPFKEEGAEEGLKRAIVEERLFASSDPEVISSAEHLIIVIGTPIDEHLNPNPLAVLSAVEDLSEYLRDGQLLILRSTVYPGVTAKVEEMIGRLGLTIDVAFCPERIAQGRALVELFKLPQIVSGRNSNAIDRSEKLFRNLADEIVHLTPEEAELAKLFTNTWRYIKFATANQLYMIANDFGLDFERIRSAIIYHYPRAADMPKAGFAAGPCLFKDTMQLAAFNNNNFMLGHASMMVNEGLPLYLVSRLESQYQLGGLVVGVLGMAFKVESDDIRSSLSYKLKRILRVKAKTVLCTDPYVSVDPDLVPLEKVLAEADLLIIGVPHPDYADLQTQRPVVDIWNLLGGGVRV